MTLPQAEIMRIEVDAKTFAHDKWKPILCARDSSNEHLSREDYVAGAQAEAVRGREMMVSFGIWLAKNFYVNGEIEDRWYNPAGDGYTTAELLDLFILDTQKGKG